MNAIPIVSRMPSISRVASSTNQPVPADQDSSDLSPSSTVVMVGRSSGSKQGCATDLTSPHLESMGVHGRAWEGGWEGGLGGRDDCSKVEVK